MFKKFEIYGLRVKLRNSDKGRAWSSRRQLIVAYGQRKQRLCLELEKSFE